MQQPVATTASIDELAKQKAFYERQLEDLRYKLQNEQATKLGIMKEADEKQKQRKEEKKVAHDNRV